MIPAALRGQFSQFSGLGTGTEYPNPFLDVASLSMPNSMRSVLYWSEFIAGQFGSYRMAMERTISYFLTSVDILKASDDEREKWEELFNHVLDILGVVQNMDRNEQVYGNAFASVIIPFRRFLACPRCKAMFTFKEVHDNPAFGFHFEIPDFIATCPACKVGAGYRGAWHVIDEKEDEEKKIKIKIWDPHEIEILHDLYTDDCSYIWRIPEDYKRQVREGKEYHLSRTPMEVLKAIAKNQVYLFDTDAIFHMKEPALAGLRVRGWGLPRTLVNFRQIWYVQVLRRFNEAIALDYVIPFRIITPAPQPAKSQGGMTIDPYSMVNGSDWRNQALQMIRRRRRDPASIQVFPFPVQFQMFGADANQLAPRDLLDQGLETLLNDVGTPIELYNGSLQLQTAPVALRLFESTWHHLVHNNNAFLRWVTRQISQIMSWELVDVEMKRVTIADNLEKQMIAAQLMMSQQLSGTTVLSDLGFNFKKEQRQIADESRYVAELQGRMEEEMQQAGFAQQIAKGQAGQAGAPQAGAGGQGQAAGQAGQAGMGMMPGGGSGLPVTDYLASMNPNTPQTPEEMLQTADMLANDLMGLPASVKNSELRRLKTYNQAMANMVKGQLDQKRRDVKSRAGNAAVGQLEMAGAPM